MFFMTSLVPSFGAVGLEACCSAVFAGLVLLDATLGAPDHVSKNGFQPTNVDFIEYKTVILLEKELNKLKGINS